MSVALLGGRELRLPRPPEEHEQDPAHIERSRLFPCSAHHAQREPVKHDRFGEHHAQNRRLAQAAQGRRVVRLSPQFFHRRRQPDLPENQPNSDVQNAEKQEGPLENVLVRRMWSSISFRRQDEHGRAAQAKTE
jgi:hypothetical protein